uniref:Uncharacterized protein n=1 Tax=uncultured prokaryote TaxID=198431 RepID=A0A0H5QPE6_9ZZZZ|nr:hypothetical protein [uncultured prokaryote]
MYKHFHVKRRYRKNFRNWLLYDTTIDPFVLFLELEDIQEIEDYFEKLKEELIRQSKESGSKI